MYRHEWSCSFGSAERTELSLVPWRHDIIEHHFSYIFSLHVAWFERPVPTVSEIVPSGGRPWDQLTNRGRRKKMKRRRRRRRRKRRKRIAQRFEISWFWERPSRFSDHLFVSEKRSLSGKVNTLLILIYYVSNCKKHKFPCYHLLIFIFFH